MPPEGFHPSSLSGIKEDIRLFDEDDNQTQYVKSKKHVF